MTVGFVMEPGVLRVASKFARAFLKKSVASPLLREKLLPHYAMGCKRVLPSNEFYPAMQRDNVELVTTGIDEVLPHGIRTKDGKEIPLDAIVLATGFQAAEACAPFEIRGRNGVELNAAWREGAEAYLGTTVSGFPNLFLVVGPNTGLGSSSMVLMIESQIAYTLSAIQTMRERHLAKVDVRPEVQARFNERLHQRLAKTVWSNDCNSWYKTRTGKNTTLWPGFTLEFRYRTRRFDADNYEVVGEFTGRGGVREVSPSHPPHLPVQSL
jgi:cation diffusion facilitator CzcD-associated flavoprotein CzcO